MSLLRYSQTGYFDFSTTASCGNSPIIITTVGTGCNAAVGNNADGKVCAPFVGSSNEYTKYSTICTNSSLDLSGYTRNYVIKAQFMGSDKCQGDPLQSFALAADGVCHYNPSGDNSTMYLKSNCNGGQPIWSECSDSACVNCKTTTYTSSPCQLAGAGTSNKVSCFTAPIVNSKPNGNGTSNSTSDSGTDPFNSSSSRNMISFPITSWLFLSCLLFHVFHV